MHIPVILKIKNSFTQRLRFATLPAPLYERMFSETFRDCITEADRALLRDMDLIEAQGRLPHWWVVAV